MTNDQFSKKYIFIRKTVTILATLDRLLLVILRLSNGTVFS